MDDVDDRRRLGGARLQIVGKRPKRERRHVLICKCAAPGLILTDEHRRSHSNAEMFPFTGMLSYFF